MKFCFKSKQCTVLNLLLSKTEKSFKEQANSYFNHLSEIGSTACSDIF